VLNKVYVVYLNHGWDGYSEPKKAFDTQEKAEAFCSRLGKHESYNENKAYWEELTIE
jgi:hypothetical protein